MGRNRIRKLPVLHFPTIEEITDDKIEHDPACQKEFDRRRVSVRLVLISYVLTAGAVACSALRIIELFDFLALANAVGTTCFLVGMCGISYATHFTRSETLRIRAARATLLDDIKGRHIELGIPLLFKRILSEVETRSEVAIAARDKLIEFRGELEGTAEALQHHADDKKIRVTRNNVIYRLTDVNDSIQALDTALKPLAEHLDTIQLTLETLTSREIADKVLRNVGIQNPARDSPLRSAEKAYARLHGELQRLDKCISSLYLEGLLDRKLFLSIPLKRASSERRA